MRIAPAALVVAVLALLGCGNALAKSSGVPRAKKLAPLTLGFSAGADVALASGSPSTQAFWVPRADNEHTQMVRLDVDWNQVAPKTLPSAFNASNPGDPRYNWTPVDAQVRELAAAHFTILITVQFAPKWAEGPNMPKSATAGTWEPNVSDLSQFAQAIAERYSGVYTDPLDPAAKLPKVSDWQVWDEPNLPEYLAPQWTGSASSGYQAVSPDMYRAMENAFYMAVTGVSASNYVVLAGLGPYGDSPSTDPDERMHPVAFERSLLCVTTQLTMASGCAGPTYFDAIDSHPYGIYGPNWHAYQTDDVSIPDVHKLVTVLDAAEKLGTALPSGGKGNWVTETSWDTDPPDPEGEPIMTQALWMEQAFYNLWKQGVSTVLWWQIVDSPPIPSYADSYQAGTYYLSGQPKPSATAFRFPFITWRTGHRAVVAWSRSPASGVVSIQEQAGANWRTLARVRVAADQVFEVRLHGLTSRKTLRAVIGIYRSLPWMQSASTEGVVSFQK